MRSQKLLIALLLAMPACHELDTPESGEQLKNMTPTQSAPGTDEALTALRERIIEAGTYTPDPGPVPASDDAKVKLGQALFFDKVVSGDQDIACSTCHHPAFGTSDGLPTSIGVGGASLGPQRASTDGFLIPRNSPDLFNRGLEEWNTMFWDARVAVSAGYFDSPAGSRLPNGLDSVLAVQAMFPPTSRHEMRGEIGDNEIGDVADDNLVGIWEGIAARLVRIDGYVELFEAAYPDVALEDIGFEHAANALAAFEISSFTKLNAPFDQFMAGDDEAMSAQQIRGAQKFFQDGGCVSCHSGPLFTDQKSHAIAAPQIGPGKKDDNGLDEGRKLETGDAADRFAFRTPPLRNVELTGPYFHAGSHDSLEEVIRHHISPANSLTSYRGEHLRAAHADTVMDDTQVQSEMIAAITPAIEGCADLTDEDVDDLVAFLQALTDASARDMTHLIPTSVPSGLPVE